MARQFGFDPVIMLTDTNDLHWSARVAAYTVVQSDIKAQNEAAAAAQRSRGGR